MWLDLQTGFRSQRETRQGASIDSSTEYLGLAASPSGEKAHEFWPAQSTRHLPLSELLKASRADPPQSQSQSWSAVPLEQPPALQVTLAGWPRPARPPSRGLKVARAQSAAPARTLWQREGLGTSR